LGSLAEIRRSYDRAHALRRLKAKLAASDVQAMRVLCSIEGQPCQSLSAVTTTFDPFCILAGIVNHERAVLLAADAFGGSAKPDLPFIEERGFLDKRCLAGSPTIKPNGP